MPLPEILFETERLICRPFEANDFDALVALQTDPHVYQYVGDGQPLSPDQVRLWIDRSRKNIETNGFGTGAIVYKDKDELIGWAGYVQPPEQEIEIIYGLSQEEWGKGLGTEIVQGLVNAARDRYELIPLQATVDPQNSRSIKLLKKIGFELFAKTKDEDGLDTDIYHLHG
ncbi:GNAT family N-acetyltransferase [Maritalea mediterranea]|uniref:GNAT family N-acetyltransferase n=1 Tax=Maritalea mediterranea TaxID=2909667 RepID=A0ABS9E404_9HYPH|nr:GNAT family N-acetyltransferase [Maritalea mediterranea]MCF4097602.1 GNAT family N-acetyltransferase [Maritalea mediterranea]